jgi:hypothetical protein
MSEHQDHNELLRSMPPWPPVDFPIYGLDGSWTGPRWLDYLGGSQNGQPTPDVWLAHSDRRWPTRGHPWVKIATFRPSGEPWAAPPVDPAEAQLARPALYSLVNLVWPDVGVDDRALLRRVTVSYCEARISRCASWAPTRWTVDSGTVTARFARFAGGWAAYLCERDRIALAAVGVGASPHDLSLLRVTSGAPYHFAIDQPIDTDTLRTSREQALGGQLLVEPIPRRPHGDHRKILSLG